MVNQCGIPGSPVFQHGIEDAEEKTVPGTGNSRTRFVVDLESAIEQFRLIANDLGGEYSGKKC